VKALAAPELRFTNVAVFPVDPKDANAIHNVDNRLGREVEIDPVRERTSLCSST
jgi:hypothetical protein